MNRWISACLSALLAAGVLFASGAHAEEAGLATVKVNISGFKGKEGVALVALYDSEQTWLKIPKAVKVLRVAITGPNMTVEFKDVKPGTYAVSVVHDANKNNELDMRWLPWPKPKEGSGCSENPNAEKAEKDAKKEPEGKVGPPKWESAKFEVPAGGVTVKTVMKYY